MDHSYTKFVMLGLVAGACTANSAHGAAIVRSASGTNSAAIQASVDQFRLDISGSGGLRAPNTGPFASGRREINWDAVGDAFSSPNNLPGDFFNNNSKRGATVSSVTPGATFQLSRNSAGAGDVNVRFGDIDPSYSTIFQAFSAQRLFTTRGTTSYDTTFSVPVFPNEAATVNGFGAVFCDVDDSALSRIEYYNAANILIGSFNVPAANNGLSFLGVSFDAGERVARVRVFTGNTALAPGALDDLTHDVVVLDDFFYGEPVPAPSAAALMVGASALVLRRRRR